MSRLILLIGYVQSWPLWKHRTAVNQTTCTRAQWDETLNPLHLAPFYVYDFVDWKTFKCTPFERDEQRLEELDDNLFLRKHSDDYWFTKHALQHPARVSKPEDAKMFVVPGYYNQIIERLVYRSWETCCVKVDTSKVCGARILVAVDALIAKSPWYRRNSGRDHVIVTSHYGWVGRNWGMKTLYWMNRITFERNFVANGRMGIASTYVGHKCQEVDAKTADVAMIARNDTITTSHCGQGDQCPALAQARIGIHARGDTWGSNRLMDTLVSGTVPAFTNLAQYDILPGFIPWQRISVMVNVKSKPVFISSVKSILSTQYPTVSQYNKDKNVDKLMDWHQPFLFEHYMAAFTTFYYDSPHLNTTWPGFTRMNGCSDTVLRCQGDRAVCRSNMRKGKLLDMFSKSAVKRDMDEHIRIVKEIKSTRSIRK